MDYLSKKEKDELKNISMDRIDELINMISGESVLDEVNVLDQQKFLMKI